MTTTMEEKALEGISAEDSVATELQEEFNAIFPPNHVPLLQGEVANMSRGELEKRQSHLKCLIEKCSSFQSELISSAVYANTDLALRIKFANLAFEKKQILFLELVLVSSRLCGIMDLEIEENFRWFTDQFENIKGRGLILRPDHQQILDMSKKICEFRRQIPHCIE